MVESKPLKFQPGQRVFVLSPYEPIIAKILAVVGQFGPDRVTVYQIRYGSKPSRNIAEVSEDLLEAAPPKKPKTPKVQTVETA